VGRKKTEGDIQNISSNRKSQKALEKGSINSCVVKKKRKTTEPPLNVWEGVTAEGPWKGHRVVQKVGNLKQYPGEKH